MADESALETETGINEDAYDLSDDREKRKAEREAEAAAAAAMRSTFVADTGPRPDWAAKHDHQKDLQARRLTGKCATYRKGFGFIARDDGLPDIYVHQRSLKRKGFRSLAVGEALEFNVEAMADGRLVAVDVTGPDRAEVQGGPMPDDSDEEDEATAGGKVVKAKLPDKLKPYTGFAPRAVKRPAPKPKPRP